MLFAACRQVSPAPTEVPRTAEPSARLSPSSPPSAAGNGPTQEPVAGRPASPPEEPPPEEPPQVYPPVIRLSVEDEAAFDAAVRDALDRGQVPGAVVLAGRRDGVVFRRAYGALSEVPRRRPMRVDALFDLASVTKLFTAVAALRLVDAGRLNLDAPVDPILPELAGRGVTARRLLTHTAGLRAVDPLTDYTADRAATIRRVLRGAPDAEPGRYHYSDLGYLALGELIARLAHKPYEQALRELVIDPLGLDARFTPGPTERVVPTERAPRRGDPAPIIHGEANDPRAWRLGGVAGHAGLFATADDLGRLAEALLGSRPLLSEASRALLAEPLALRDRRGRPVRRSLAADMTPRPTEGWTSQAFGHGGYTGTWMWIDPALDLYLVVLTSRVHPDGRGRAGPLRSALSRALTDALPRLRPPAPSAARLGIDLLRAARFAPLLGKRVALLTNDAARARDGARTWVLLRDAPGVALRRIFTPEHGLGADREGRVADGELDGVELVSLFGRRRTPAPEKLADVDVVVVDLQDVGARFYTYGATLGRVLEVAAEVGVPVMVLDRPNPLGGSVAGPVLQPRWRSFVNHQPGWPILHGLTIGELARLLVAERSLPVDLRVMPLEGWRRRWRWPETGLRWVPPSPNLRTPAQVLLYPGVALLEGTNLSVGRGTQRPFEQLGAPWMEPEALIAAVPEAAWQGVRLSPTRFRPRVGPYRGRWCRGVAIEVVDAERVRPVELGLALVAAMHAVHPRDWEPERVVRMLGDARVAEALARGDLRAAEAYGAEERAAFEARRRPLLLY